MDSFEDDVDDYIDDDEEDEPSLTADQIREAMERHKDRRFAPKPYKLTHTKKRLAIVDSETDPFERGVIVAPFTIGFYDGERYVDFWGDDCVIQFFDYLATLDDEYIIYAHNGGKFDFFFFLKYLDAGQSPLIMNGRLVKIHFAGQEFRDSYSIIPQALSTYKKDEIDYDTFKRPVRNKHKAAILAYQKTDCVYTYDLITGFHDMFGDKITIASAALPTLHSLHGFERMQTDKGDARFRDYYYGGRNQCFETGILRPSKGERFLLIDRNSMYPAVMKDELHPISARFTVQTRITKETDFATIIAHNDGALPSRALDGGLDFTKSYGEFHATIHEINAGLETGTLRIDRVKRAWTFERKATFEEFVLRFYGLRLDAKAADDKVRDILYKFVLNSGYGKFALNPRKFKQWTMTIGTTPEPLWRPDAPDGWTLHSASGHIHIWSRPTPRKGGFYNIATAASITGAARANLLRTISRCKRPIYCDTDSVLCEAYDGILEPEALGGWKLEATGNMAAIAGKKLYAIFDDNDAIKSASKGVRLTPQDIMAVCTGQEIVWRSDVPTFRLGRDLDAMGDHDFIERRIKMTGKGK